jgi:hypothetical protein
LYDEFDAFRDRFFTKGKQNIKPPSPSKEENPAGAAAFQPTPYHSLLSTSLVLQLCFLSHRLLFDIKLSPVFAGLFKALLSMAAVLVVHNCATPRKPLLGRQWEKTIILVLHCFCLLQDLYELFAMRSNLINAGRAAVNLIWMIIGIRNNIDLFSL